MKILGIIPARYASTRFPGKPLKDIDGSPMIEWVYRRAENASIDRLVVATDDKRIHEAVTNFGGEAVMTSGIHENGTSRIIEVINIPEYSGFDFVINIQGDEPLIDIASINLLAESFRKDNTEIVTLKKEIKGKRDIENPNIVKVVTDFNNNALYFSRAVIPYASNGAVDFKYYGHIGIYGYTVEFLNKLKGMEAGILEKVESLEQLRFMENGYKIKVLETDTDVIGVDTPEDLEEVIRYIKENRISIKSR